ncbi:unnamed protein product [Mytilus coruscus]|uniref:DUF7869 domain-containing protein n=1 Tax=Mytilus coruscus TaxID=42192 RepID=A0A6J8ADS7_MYTCO|nr:unnamed protein product [Mytilus coruscus]
MFLQSKLPHSDYIKKYGKNQKSIPSNRLLTEQADGTRCVQLTTFKNVLSSCCPQIRFASIHSDVCSSCKKLRESVTLAQTEEKKIESSQNYISHIEAARRERELYNEWLSKSREEFSNYNQRKILKNVHYTIDFAQSISLPHHTDQVGQLHFLSGRKVKVFGVCMEGKRKKYNYLVDEDEGILKDCVDTKGPNATNNMFDHAVECYGLNEAECGIHCDNCPGENKNRYMTGYLAWCVLTRQHQKISLMMQFSGHTKCLVDAGFGQAKKLFRRSNCDTSTLSHLADVFRKSSSTNEVVQHNQENNETTWQWRDWKPFLSALFKPVPGIRKYHHFVFGHDKLCIVIVKEKCNGIEKEINILRRPLEQFDPLARPEAIPAAGLSRARHEYLYSKVRPYARKEYQAAFCQATGEE